MGAGCSCLQADNRNTQIDRTEINSTGVQSHDGNFHSYEFKLHLVSRNIESQMTVNDIAKRDANPSIYYDKNRKTTEVNDVSLRDSVRPSPKFDKKLTGAIDFKDSELIQLIDVKKSPELPTHTYATEPVYNESERKESTMERQIIEEEEKQKQGGHEHKSLQLKDMQNPLAEIQEINKGVPSSKQNSILNQSSAEQNSNAFHQYNIQSQEIRLSGNSVAKHGSIESSSQHEFKEAEEPLRGSNVVVMKEVLDIQKEHDNSNDVQVEKKDESHLEQNHEEENIHSGVDSQKQVALEQERSNEVKQEGKNYDVNDEEVQQQVELKAELQENQQEIDAQNQEQQVLKEHQVEDQALDNLKAQENDNESKVEEIAKEYVQNLKVKDVEMISENSDVEVQRLRSHNGSIYSNNTSLRHIDSQSETDFQRVGGDESQASGSFVVKGNRGREDTVFNKIEEEEDSIDFMGSEDQDDENYLKRLDTEKEKQRRRPQSIAQKNEFIEQVEKVSFNSDRKLTVQDRQSQKIDDTLNQEHKEQEVIMEEAEKEESVMKLDTEENGGFSDTQSETFNYVRDQRIDTFTSKINNNEHILGDNSFQVQRAGKAFGASKFEEQDSRDKQGTVYVNNQALADEDDEDDEIVGKTKANMNRRNTDDSM